MLYSENHFKTHPNPGLLEEILFYWHRSVLGAYNFVFFAFNQDVMPGAGAHTGDCHICCVPWLVSPQTHRFETAATGDGLRAGIWSYSVFSGMTYLMHMDLIHF